MVHRVWTTLIATQVANDHSAVVQRSASERDSVCCNARMAGTLGTVHL